MSSSCWTRSAGLPSTGGVEHPVMAWMPGPRRSPTPPVASPSPPLLAAPPAKHTPPSLLPLRLLATRLAAKQRMRRGMSQPLKQRSRRQCSSVPHPRRGRCASYRPPASAGRPCPRLPPSNTAALRTQEAPRQQELVGRPQNAKATAVVVLVWVASMGPGHETWAAAAARAAAAAAAAARMRVLAAGEAQLVRQPTEAAARQLRKRRRASLLLQPRSCNQGASGLRRPKASSSRQMAQGLRVAGLHKHKWGRAEAKPPLSLGRPATCLQRRSCAPLLRLERQSLALTVQQQQQRQWRWDLQERGQLRGQK
mmetsp:Transcript_10267/g.27991  ORF Transcript_10267/g.27991 Transcript_10267/m.27991 type:complete len:310 (+) Transcript_10267:488-1417(+)